MEKYQEIWQGKDVQVVYKAKAGVREILGA